MEDKVIQKYFCSFCTKNKRNNCKMEILEEEKCCNCMYKCLNYQLDRTKVLKHRFIPYEIKSNKIEQ